MKTANIFSEDGQSWAPITVPEYDFLSDEEKKRVKCGHFNLKGEQCMGDVCPCVRAGKDGKDIFYFRSTNHIPGCEAAVISTEISIVEDYDIYGNDIVVEDLFKSFMAARNAMKKIEKIPRGSDVVKKTKEEEEKEPPEMSEAYERKKRKPNLKKLTRILRQRALSGTYGNMPVYELLFDEFSILEHKIGKLSGSIIVIAFPRRLFYDKEKNEIYLTVKSSKNERRWANFTLIIEKKSLFRELIAGQFDDNHIFLNRPIAFIGEIRNNACDGKYDEYLVMLHNNKSAFIVSDDIFEHNHEGF